MNEGGKYCIFLRGAEQKSHFNEDFPGALICIVTVISNGNILKPAEDRKWLMIS